MGGAGKTSGVHAEMGKDRVWGGGLDGSGEGEGRREGIAEVGKSRQS